MWGIFLRLLSFGLLDTGGILACCGGSICAICALCGLYKCSTLRVRDCACLKWCLRAAGSDDFDDFDLVIIIHEATFTSVAKRKSKIRVTAGRHKVQTHESNKATFHEALQIFIEQGTPCLLVELMDGRNVMASLKLDIVRNLLEGGRIVDKHFEMQTKSKGISSCRVKLTMHVENDIEAGKSLISDMNLSKSSEMILHQQLMKKDKLSGGSGDEEAKPTSQIQTLVSGLHGTLDLFGSLGSTQSVFVTMSCPAPRKYMLCVFKDEKEYSRGSKPTTVIDMFKILAVEEDPGRSDVFHVAYMDNQKKQHRLNLRRVDLPTGTWVELLSKLIKLIREERDARRKLQTPS